jgi:hypothetical protein
MYDSQESGLGGRFWLRVLGLTVGGIIAAAILFGLFGWAWYAWGLFGAFLALAVIALAFGYFYDRREGRRAADY